MFIPKTDYLKGYSTKTSQNLHCEKYLQRLPLERMTCMGTSPQPSYNILDSLEPLHEVVSMSTMTTGLAPGEPGGEVTQHPTGWSGTEGGGG